MINYLTIDVEEWFQVFYLKKLIPHNEWHLQISTIEPMLETILETLKIYNTKATFFVIGWLALKNRSLIKQIHDEGHEIGSHSYWHQEVSCSNKEIFFEDIKRSKDILEDTISSSVFGFRAPGYSIGTKETGWALEQILKAGYVYDSSILHSKITEVEIIPNLIEIMPNSVRFGNLFFPINGGFAFRCLPYFLYKKYIQKINNRNTRLVFYIHSWEYYTKWPKKRLKHIKTFVQYNNVKGVRNKFHRLLNDFRFTSIANGMKLK